MDAQAEKRPPNLGAFGVLMRTTFVRRALFELGDEQRSVALADPEVQPGDIAFLRGTGVVPERFGDRSAPCSREL